MRLYFDSAYVAKCYLNEPDGESVRDLARRASELYSSSLCIAEVACVLHRHLREGALSRKTAAAVREQFLTDIENEVWAFIPVSDHLLQRVELLTRRLPVSCYLRAGEAIHLASAVEAGFREIWTNDRHLLAAAECAGLGGRSVTE